MKINKKVCINCHKNCELVIPWDAEDENLWKENKIYCVEMISGRYASYAILSNNEIPSVCKYKLEHTVLVNGKND